ncbi:invasion associated locus B family protein [Litorivita sp. NS0012-18]|uniref:invasion associated locus B family protein n=1 Tax=Litorivita sp. NS0012-18 TaxID=3127655 RepID=UPI00310AD0C9
MPKLLTSLSLAALLAASAAFAQSTDTAAPADSTAAAAPAAEESADGGLVVGQEEAPAGPYTKEEVGDWRLQCFPTSGEPSDADPCHIYQLLKDETGNAVAEISLFRLPDGGKAVAGATVVVPLETLLTAQLRISVDGGKAKVYPYSFCNKIGCYARIGLTSADIAQFKKGAKATVTLVPFVAPDQKIALDLSLTGFTAGFDKASVVAQ